MKTRYQDWRPSASSVDLLVKIDGILQDYAAQGFVLTLRQLYYQLIGADLFPEDRKWVWTGARWARSVNGTKNAEPNYTWLGGIVGRGRLAGFIDWAIIEDRGRNVERTRHYKDGAALLRESAMRFALDMWERQEWYIELWCEKDALSGILSPICAEHDIPYMANRGYSSLSAMYEAARRFEKHEGKAVEIIYLGDHDPSGIDMVRDIETRLETLGFAVPVNRIALNLDQVQRFNPPENPAKSTDSRYAVYRAQFGDSSWELDALQPGALRDLVVAEIEKYLDVEIWNEDVARARKVQAQIYEVADSFATEEQSKEEDNED